MAPEQVIVYIVGPVVGYLMGSVPFAFVIGRSKGVDLRTVGSKNVGATNLGRALGARYFWYAFVLDVMKGFLPVLAMSLLVPQLKGPAPQIQDGRIIMMTQPDGTERFVGFDGTGIAESLRQPMPR